MTWLLALPQLTYTYWQDVSLLLLSNDIDASILKVLKILLTYLNIKNKFKYGKPYDKIDLNEKKQTLL